MFEIGYMDGRALRARHDGGECWEGYSPDGDNKKVFSGAIVGEIVEKHSHSLE